MLLTEVYYPFRRVLVPSRQIDSCSPLEVNNESTCGLYECLAHDRNTGVMHLRTKLKFNFSSENAWIFTGLLEELQIF